MARCRWLIGVALSLAACSGSGGGADTTLGPPVVDSTRPSGFGGTLPIPSTTVLVATTAPAAALAPTTAVSTTAVLTTNEAALRARVLAYDRAFREELLHEPTPDFKRLLTFFPKGSTREGMLPQFIEDVRTQKAYRLNKPDIYNITIEKVEPRSAIESDVTTCVEDNIVTMGPGLDGRGSTADDVIVNDRLGSDRYTDRWQVTDEGWVLSAGVSTDKLGTGALCGHA